MYKTTTIVKPSAETRKKAKIILDKLLKSDDTLLKIIKGARESEDHKEFDDYFNNLEDLRGTEEPEETYDLEETEETDSPRAPINVAVNPENSMMIIEVGLPGISDREDITVRRFEDSIKISTEELVQQPNLVHYTTEIAKSPSVTIRLDEKYQDGEITEMKFSDGLLTLHILPSPRREGEVLDWKS